MIKNRIRELRKALGLQQATLAALMGTTQQTISRIENGVYDIPIDMLIQLAEYFHVSTDYILGITEIKRNSDSQVHMNKGLDQCYDILHRYTKLTEINKKTFKVVLERLEQAQMEQVNHNYNTDLLVEKCEKHVTSGNL